MYPIFCERSRLYLSTKLHELHDVTYSFSSTRPYNSTGKFKSFDFYMIIGLQPFLDGNLVY